AQALEQVQRKLQAMRLLGVDVQSDVVMPGEPRQPQQARVELGEDAFALRPRVAWVQRGELDRDAGPAMDPESARGRADRFDGLLVCREVASRVVVGEGGLAQHVVRVAKAP